ncbi:MAG: imidazole glycerol phosphate synthase subunit HisH [Nitrososphaerales archaeon]
MSPRKIQILDYGSGNLFSIKDAINRSSENAEALIASSFDEDSDALVLPGVGSFNSAQRILGQNRQAILKAVNDKHLPLLGVCLGMQLLFEKSEEGPGKGLGLFKGCVKRFLPSHGIKVPHMGWNEVNFLRNSGVSEGLNASEWAYYVHSFYPVPEDQSIVGAWTEYAGQKFPALVAKDNIFGTQFHPEKSHIAGARIIGNFVKIAVIGSEL